MNMPINIGAFAILSILWLGFAAALIFNQSMLDTAWPLWLRLVLVIGLGWVTIYTFFPRRA